MASSLTYNGIQLDIFQTAQFTAEAVYDPSHTDYLYTKITIGVKAYLNKAKKPANANEKPSDTLVRIRKYLMTQNAKLIFKDGTTTLIESPVGTADEDVKHGPFPVRCNVMEMTEATYLIEFVVETYIIECCEGASLPYLSNRWTETDTINEDMYTRRTIKGQIVFRADRINSKKFDNAVNSADSYRGLIAPPGVALQPDFTRTQMDFLTTPDGLSLDYTIVDEEKYCQPPDNMTRFTGEHIVTCSKGAVYSDIITVSAWGNAKTPKAALLASAAKLILGRLDLTGTRSGNKKIKAGVVKDKLHENFVEIRVETFGGTRPTNFFNGLNFAKPDQPTQLDWVLGDRRSTQQPNPGFRGTADLAMTTFSNYLSLCVNFSERSLSTVPIDIFPPNAPNTSPYRAAVVPTLPQTPTLFNQAELSTGVYTDWWMEIEYLQNYGKIQLAYMDESLTKCAVIPVAQRTMKKVVRFKAERWGLPPTIPDALANMDNSELLFRIDRPLSQEIAPDGVTQIFTTSGEYTYAVLDPTKENVLNGGVPPYTTIERSLVSDGVPSSSLVPSGIIGQALNGFFGG